MKKAVVVKKNKIKESTSKSVELKPYIRKDNEYFFTKKEINKLAEKYKNDGLFTRVKNISIGYSSNYKTLVVDWSRASGRLKEDKRLELTYNVKIFDNIPAKLKRLINIGEENEE